MGVGGRRNGAGRPPRPEGEASRRRSVSLPAELAADLAAWGRSRGLKRASAVRTLAILGLSLDPEPRNGTARGRERIVLTLEPETAEAIEAYAHRRGLKFSAALATLAAAGLETHRTDAV